MGLVSGLLSVVCLAVVAVHLARLVRPAGDALGGPVGELSHAVMALGMAAMFSPLGDPLPDPLWIVTYLLCGAWFTAVAVRDRSVHGDAAHHVVGSAAMLFMVLTGHNDHPDGHPASGGAGLVPLVAIVLAGYFAWHALRCVDRLPAEPAQRGGDGAVAQRVRVLAVRSPQTVALAHVVMAGAMTVMLLATI